MASTAEQILTGMSFLHEKATAIGDQRLADVIRTAIDTYEATPSSNAPTPASSASPVAPVTEQGPEDTVPEPVDVTLTVAGPGVVLVEEDYDALDELENQVDEAILAAALPENVILTITGLDGLIPHEEGALLAARTMLDSLSSLTESEFALGQATQTIRQSALTGLTETGWEVAINAANHQARSALMGLGIGMDAINGVVPVPGGLLQVTSLVGQPADPEAAAELGIGAPDLPAARNGHQINAGVDAVEDTLGVRPQVATLEVTYRREDGAELSVEQTHTIVSSPVSQHPQMGLPRFGELVLIEVMAGEEPHTKTAVFGVLGVGEVDPASMLPRVVALTGMATMYQGTLPFDGLGQIHCTSTVTAAPGHNPEA